MQRAQTKQEARPFTVPPGWAAMRGCDVNVAQIIFLIAQPQRTPQMIWSRPTEKEMVMVSAMLDCITQLRNIPEALPWGNGLKIRPLSRIKKKSDDAPAANPQDIEQRAQGV